MGTESRACYVSSPGVVGVCIDAGGDGGIGGRFYHRYEEAAVRFDSLEKLFLQMDRLYDTIDYPQASTRTRSFRGGRCICSQLGRGTLMEKNPDCLKHRGDVATFVVHVRFRQNASWQGEVFWAEKEETVSFRSALELMKLIDSAVDRNEG